MYHKDQEETVFSIVISIVALFQAGSILILYTNWMKVNYYLVILSVNVIILYGVIKYARWLWKNLELLGVLRRIIKYELIILSIPLGLIIFIKCFNSYK